jgi:tripartite motif-containing protein 71
MKRAQIVLAALALSLGLAACEGDTDPATNITNLSARLNFTGHANSGPAYSYFEYWRTSTPATKFTTPTRNWPGGAQGTFGETVTGLTPNTNYSFRACGGDQGDAAVCRTTRSFTTLAGTSYAFDRTWGTLGTADGQFDGPLGIATDRSGNVYVADTRNNRVQKFSSTGTFITKWAGGGPGNEFFQPSGVATDSVGNVYVAEGNNRIQKFNSSGGFITKWGTTGSGNGQFSAPFGVATDPSGNVYVADRGNSRIQKFSSTGAFITKWGTSGSGNGQFTDVRNVATDPAGNVYTTETQTGSPRVQKFSSTGAFITKWGSGGSADGAFSSPRGIATDSAGSVYVVDTGNQRIQKFTSSGGFITKFGFVPQFASGVAVDRLGSVYVTETLLGAAENRVQKFKPTG